MRTPFDILACPRSRQPLRRLPAGELATLRAKIPSENLPPGGFESEGWVNADGSFIYPEVDGLPILLPERAVFVSEGQNQGAVEPPDPARLAWMQGQQALWEQLAQVWVRQPPPIRPMPEDTRLLEERVRDWQAERDREIPRALVLGVTPESVLMGWPAGTRILSVDFSTSMIRKVWPGAGQLNAGVVCGEWTALPVATASCDLAVGDGVFSARSYPDGYCSMVRELARVVKPGGLVLSRVFTRPAGGDSVESVFEDLHAGRSGSFDHFRWRLGTALPADIRRGVRMGDVWDVWHERVPDPGPLLARLGWPKDASVVFDRYRGLDARMTFPSVEELSAVFAPEFTLVDCRHPEYELGDRCPTFCFRRSAR